MKIKKKAVSILAGLVVVGIVSHVAFSFSARRSPMWQYAASALKKTKPNYDLRNCVDLDAKDRKDFTDTKWKPHACINTASSNYNPDFRAGNCAKFVQDPGKWHFSEVRAKDAVPGDLIIFFKKNGYARHAAVYTQNSLLGPLCATTMYPSGYYRYFPYKLCVWFTRWFGSFSSVKYYRYSPSAG
jgi:hypothetical protein